MSSRAKSPPVEHHWFRVFIRFGNLGDVIFFNNVPFPSFLLQGLLKPCTSDWDLNPLSQDSNPAKTYGLPTEITYLVSGLNEAQVLDVSSQKEFSERQSNR